MEKQTRQFLTFLYNRHIGIDEQPVNEFLIKNSFGVSKTKTQIARLVDEGLIRCSENWRQLGNVSIGVHNDFNNTPLDITLTLDGVIYCKSIIETNLQANSTSSSQEKSSETGKLLAFISFCEEDRNKMEELYKALEPLPNIRPIIVERDISLGALTVQEKVKDNIRKASFFIPILTKQSIGNQWVNQEIGCAYGFMDKGQKMEIHPIVERELLDTLRGFINKQNQIAHSFATGILDVTLITREEAENYTKCCLNLSELLRTKTNSYGKYSIA